MIVTCASLLMSLESENAHTFRAYAKFSVFINVLLETGASVTIPEIPDLVKATCVHKFLLQRCASSLAFFIVCA